MLIFDFNVVHRSLEWASKFSSTPQEATEALFYLRSALSLAAVCSAPVSLTIRTGQSTLGASQDQWIFFY